MPQKASYTPRYRRHKSSGRAIVALNGRDHYLGLYKSKASHIEYDRVIGEWLTAGRQSPQAARSESLTVLELCSAYLDFAEKYYVKDGRQTNEVLTIRLAIRALKESYGRTKAIDFGPLALQTMQLKLAERELMRTTVNAYSSIYKRMFKWAHNRELLPAVVFQAIQPVPGLKAGRSPAKESVPVQPVSVEIVELTLPYLPPIVADMVQLQLLTGTRSQDICYMRPKDVDRSASPWCYIPFSHKTSHLGKERRIYIGPQAQAILEKYLNRESEQYCFRPIDSEALRNRIRRELGQTPMTPSQAKRKDRPLDRRRKAPGLHYNNVSYRRVIVRACDLRDRELKKLANQRAVELGQAKLYKFTEEEPRLFESWHPHQLRHTAGTSLRKKFGAEAAQLVLGHSNIKVTEIYAERNFDMAMKIAKEVG